MTNTTVANATLIPPMPIIAAAKLERIDFLSVRWRRCLAASAAKLSLEGYRSSASAVRIAAEMNDLI
jgi:hypothetical protein